MKQKLLVAFVILGAVKNLTAQNVGFGTTTPHASAALEINSTAKGVLIPRMTTAQRNAIVSPAVGLIIFNLDDKCADVWNGTGWIKNCGAIITDETVGTTGWLQKTNFGGTERYFAVGFSIGAKGYIGTGRIFSGVGQKDFWEYDPVANSWTQKADFGGTARYSAVGFSIGAKGYIGTGYDGTLRNDFWEYDPSSNTWTQRTNFGGTARLYAVGFSIGTKGYIGTGYDGSSSKRDFWEYNPSTDSWLQKSDLISASLRRYAVGFSIGTKGYIGTGLSPVGFKKDFWEYDPSSNTWTQRADFDGTAREHAVGFSIGTKGYIGAGFDGTLRNDFWEYDPSSNSWIQRTHFGGMARESAVGFSIGTKGYIGTGTDGINRKDFWEYDSLYQQVRFTNIIGLLHNEPNQTPTLQNGWVNHGLGFADAKYYKDKEGVVHLRGLIKNGTFTFNTVLFTLPAGYQPSTSGTLIFNVENAGTMARVDVKANGDVVVVTATSNAFLNLTGISFRAD